MCPRVYEGVSVIVYVQCLYFDWSFMMVWVASLCVNGEMCVMLGCIG